MQIWHFRLSPRTYLWAISLTLGFLAGTIASQSSIAESAAISKMLGWSIGFVSCLALWLFFPEIKSKKTQMLWLLFCAIVLRIAYIPMDVSDDVHRYLWEGNLVTQGVSPYLATADSPIYEPHIDEHWGHMNHKDRLTAYPPMAQYIFASATLVAYEPWVFKALFTGIDLALIALLCYALASSGLSPLLAILYAANPIILFAFAGEAHFDVCFLFAVLASLLFAKKRLWQFAWLSLTIAILLKVVAVILIPFYIIHSKGKGLWLAALLALVAIAPYLSSLPLLLKGIIDFGRDSAYGGSIHAILRFVLADTALASFFVAILFCAVIAWASLYYKEPYRMAAVAFGALIVLSPITHYWYLSWLLVLLPFMPSLAWLCASATFGLYFLTWRQVELGNSWHLPLWAQLAQWLPVLTILGYESRHYWKRIFNGEITYAAPQSVSVLIPVLNDAENLKCCLAQLQLSSMAMSDIVVCGADPKDPSKAIAKAHGASWITAPKGRGGQIAAAATRAKGDILLILHADSRLPPKAIEHLLNALSKNPSAVGGCLGQRFDTQAYKLALIEGLNDMRATFGGVSFGDQGQFIRREVAVKLGGLPKQPLMEDVELSLLMMSQGPALMLNSPLQVSARRWQKEAFFKRIRTIIYFVIQYRLRRHKNPSIASELYHKYYP